MTTMRSFGDGLVEDKLEIQNRVNTMKILAQGVGLRRLLKFIVYLTDCSSTKY